MGRLVYVAMAMAMMTALAAACGVFGREPKGLRWGDTVSCTYEIKADYKRHVQVFKYVNERYRDSLMGCPRVIGSGVGSVYEGRNRTDEVDIIVFVKPGSPSAKVDPPVAIPASIEGCTVDVQLQSAEPIS